MDNYNSQTHKGFVKTWHSQGHRTNLNFTGLDRNYCLHLSSRNSKLTSKRY